MGTELVLKHRAQRARLYTGCSRHLVDLEHAVEAGEVETDHTAEGVGFAALDAADDRRPAAEGNRRQPGFGAPVENRHHIVLVGWLHDDIGRVKTYEAIVKGQNLPEPGIPESFNVLVKELQALGLKVTLGTTEAGDE